MYPHAYPYRPTCIATSVPTGAQLLLMLKEVADSGEDKDWIKSVRWGENREKEGRRRGEGGRERCSALSGKRLMLLGDAVWLPFLLLRLL